IDMRWEVITGTGDFFDATKTMHNALQGSTRDLTDKQRKVYLDTNRENAERLNLDADVVVIHDPQPAPLINMVTRKCPWIWRRHIDAERPNRGTWRFLSGMVSRYDASVFSIAAFARVLPHPQYLIAPAIDPLSAKNCDLESSEVGGLLSRYRIDPARPI